MNQRVNLEVLGAATGAAIALGNLLAPVDAAASQQPISQALGRSVLTQLGPKFGQDNLSPTSHAAGAEQLDNTGPNLPTNLSSASKELDAELDAEGPNSCLAAEIAGALGLSAANRASVITSGNIKLIKKETVTNRQDPGALACNGQTSVKIANTHPSSVAYTIAANQVPAASAKYVKKTAAGYVLKHAVIGVNGENSLVSGGGKLPKKSIANAINIDVSAGVAKAVPAAHIAPGHYIINGKNVSFTTFQAEFDQDLADAEAEVAAQSPAPAANPGSSEAPSTPPSDTDTTPTTPTPVPTTPTTPTPPPVTTPTPPPPPPPPQNQDPYTSNAVGADESWAQCGTPDEQLSDTDFSYEILDVTDGEGYSTDPCLSSEAMNFTGSIRTLYVNTGWYSQSSHVNANSPRSCNTGDEDCLAYNYGYNAGQYAYQAAADLGIYSVTWWLDIEPPPTNTWSDDTIQNQNSLQGEHDALVADGATTVGAYSTTATWDTITGNWVNNWPSWGGTTWTTAGDAKTYCTGHQFTGPNGPSYLMQFIDKNPQTGDTIDGDVAC